MPIGISKRLVSVPVLPWLVPNCRAPPSPIADELSNRTSVYPYQKTDVLLRFIQPTYLTARFGAPGYTLIFGGTIPPHVRSPDFVIAPEILPERHVPAIHDVQQRAGLKKAHLMVHKKNSPRNQEAWLL